MPAYILVFPQDISGFAAEDPTVPDPYDSQIEALMAPYDGRYLRLRTQPIAVLEGTWQPPLGMGILEFPSMEQARAFWDAAAYAPLKAWRQARGRFDILLVDGMPAGETLRIIEQRRLDTARQAAGLPPLALT
jgi:uncharacterized protein (DUF1330 family)